MQKLLKTLVIFCLLSFIFANKTFASNFSTEFNATYRVNADASTDVKFDINLKNLSKTNYVSKYNLNVGFVKIANLKVSDKNGLIDFHITPTDNGNIISINFNKRVVGLDKTLAFDITFRTNEIAQNLKHLWEINIPGIAEGSNFDTYNVKLTYPESLGIPEYIKPNIKNTSTLSGVLNFSKDMIKNSGISLAFGNYQIYDLNLKYHLKNNNVFSVNKFIALPPSTNYQNVLLNEITPNPISITKDSEGNWIANYKLKPMEELNIQARVKVKVSFFPKTEDINNELKDKYLLPQKYWEADNSNIINIAKEIKTPKQIYDYVIKKLSYNYKITGTSNRLDINSILKNPSNALCLEFTDLFIAISRAAGIPAREVDGYAYTGNLSQRPLLNSEDILHAWPEYYDFTKKMWIMVDPTWGKTTGGVDYFNTLDFDHIAFSIKGEDSVAPIPAGGYKINKNINSKDVEVTIGDSFNSFNKMSIKLDNESKYISGINQIVNILVYNNGNSLINNKRIDLNSNILYPHNQTVYTDEILPFAFEKIPVTIKSNSILTNEDDVIKISLDNNTYYKKISFLPFYKNILFIIGGLIFVSISIILPIIAYGFRRLSIPK